MLSARICIRIRNTTYVYVYAYVYVYVIYIYIYNTYTMLRPIGRAARRPDGNNIADSNNDGDSILVIRL